jgi:hypothetical protein
LLQHLETIQPRQHAIENNGLVAALQRFLQAFRAGVRAGGVEAEGPEVIGHQAAQLRVIVYEENPGGWSGCVS